ncbi:KUP system potassium uptake protein [Quadrisphaera granulorum]|uniref:Probable potassium transport system protein Kup n=1 Tax=Quadrisphaera granulorum TaxID=317664 RepID=A0A316AUS0_9ACTN|nr:KUP/HAK/KT family potassium transporter [Quadrisphaera granulorum]PWJ53847.1 KUP system potassium uptake protein [Quadrisphaera granulorum]SZE96604.1 KUP system potassium uptake protein [Quadrisphaera granulorum]
MTTSASAAAVPAPSGTDRAATHGLSGERLHGPGRSALVLGALGVVFGDIGTSPIYTIQTLFSPDDPHPVPLSADNVLGLVSMVFWSVTLVVTVLYVGVVLRADNHGEGGLMSLITLLGRRGRDGSRLSPRLVAGLTAAGIAGASLFLADSMITPAVSVLSAVEGMEVVNPGLKAFVVPVTMVIIVVLFAVQRFGTAKVGAAFGPVMALWFTVIGVAGLAQVVGNPGVLRALSPTYAVGFFLAEPGIAFFALATVVLSVTGAEALYADLGHFGRPAISRAWLFLVYPALLLSYAGQGALLLGDLSADGPVTAPFFRSMPSWALLPVVVLATAATVIASQAVITGAFSAVRQAVRLGYLPRLRITHTSAHTIGQIYVPWVNWALMVAVVLLVAAFESSAALAFAYGMSVTGTILITTSIITVVAAHQWSWPRPVVYLGGGAMALLMLLFLAAGLSKLAHGAWVPLVIGAALFTVMSTWARGRVVVTRLRTHHEGPLSALLTQVHEAGVARVPGTAIYLNRASDDGTSTAPLAMRATVEHLHVLHEQVVLVAVETAQSPYVPLDEVARVLPPPHDDAGHEEAPGRPGRPGDPLQVVLRFGYMQRTDVPDALAVLREREGLDLDLEGASWFLSTIELRRASGDDDGDGHGVPQVHLPRWQRGLFTATARLTTDAARSFDLPAARTVVMGSRIEV